jgi:hypothetical protein|tara:strand:- start:6412 stop:7188 length:777 start_codon:yes stop_codon:yes gene_type:complete
MDEKDISDWKILNKYDFKLLPGEPNKMPEGDYSYYQYLNSRWQETGKNVLCQEFLLKDLKEKDLVVVEPFGGCGVFSVAIQKLLEPEHHIIGELDEACVKQLNYIMADYKGVSVFKEDAHERLGVIPADIYVCDFPFFTYIRHEEGLWRKEMERMTSHDPKAIIITDGSSCRWHFMIEHLLNRDVYVTDNRESYAPAFSLLMERLYKYHVTAMGYHGTCFYIKIEPKRSSTYPIIEYKNIPAGKGHNGLKPVGGKLDV